MSNLRLFLLSLTVGAASLAHAATPAASPPGDAGVGSVGRAAFSNGRMQSLIVAALDTDRDGILSQAEVTQAPTALRALDLNADGALSGEELRRFEANRPTRGVRLSSGFNVAFTLDANRDGEIQAMEIANAPLSLKALDANGDGQITGNELRPATLYAQVTR